MTDLLRVHNKCKKIKTAKLSALRISCAKIACCSSELVFRFLYVGRSMQNASGQFISCIHFSFVNFALRSTPQKECKESERRDGRSVRAGFQQLYLRNNSELVARSYDFFFQNCLFCHLQKYWHSESLFLPQLYKQSLNFSCYKTRSLIPIPNAMNLVYILEYYFFRKNFLSMAWKPGLLQHMLLVS
jgi:hypothetical protein